MRSSTVNQSIALKLLKIVFAIYFVVTFIITVTHIVVEYSQTEKLIRHELSFITQSYQSGLAQSFWDIDEKQVISTGQGLAILPVVTGVEIFDNKKELIYVSGRVPEKVTYESQSETSNEFYHQAPIIYKYKDKSHQMGLVRI